MKKGLHGPKEDLSGQHFGKWTALSYDKKKSLYAGKRQTKRKRSVTHWKCKCECGDIQSVSQHGLKSGQSTQCKACGKSKRYGHSFGKHMKRIKDRVKASNLDVNINVEYLERLLQEQKYKCALTGQILVHKRIYHDNGETTASVDRIDSSKGYIKGNVQWVHKDINKLKMNYKQEDFIEWCNLVAQMHPIEVNCE